MKPLPECTCKAKDCVCSVEIYPGEDKKKTGLCKWCQAGEHEIHNHGPEDDVWKDCPECGDSPKKTKVLC